jgi:hypothetical protein
LFFEVSTNQGVSRGREPDAKYIIYVTAIEEKVGGKFW